MAESSLSVGLPELRAEVGFFLGYGRTAGTWSAGQLAEIDTIVQSGVRRVYYPPAIHPGLPAYENISTVGYEWSWLRPTTDLDIVAGVADYSFPDDFGRLVGAFHYPPDAHRASVVIVSVGKLLSMRAFNNQKDAPRYAAVRYKQSDGTGGQRQEVLFHPEPNAPWTLSYEYEAYSGALTDAAPYPLGGMQLAELYIESCLAVAESRVDDELGQHNRQFELLLVDAVARDRKRGARNFGQMGHVEPHGWRVRRGDTGSTYPITYKGEPL